MFFLSRYAPFFFVLSLAQAQNTSPAAETLITGFENNITVLGASCAARVYSILAAYPGSITLLDESGLPTDNKTGDAWGISYPDCKRICGVGIKAFVFSDFQLQFTSWLLVCSSKCCLDWI
jgi:hypothetical protein